MQNKASLNDLINSIFPMIQNQLPEIVTIKIVDRESFMIHSKTSNESINIGVISLCKKYSNVSTNLKYGTIMSLTKSPNN